ncbi:hypothetical protein M8R90_23805, partial [Enterobacter hormaechei]|nr:hypothetical protein [Enterobacter hormaechei]
LHGDVIMCLMKALLISRCINQRGAGHNNAALTNDSRAKLYVGLTRPVKSVAIVFHGGAAFNSNGIKIYAPEQVP